MEYSKIIAVSGLTGLHELINSKTDGAIVRSLDDKSTKFVSSRIHNFSHLESIEVYTTRENVNLVEIFNAMESSGQSLPDDRDAKAVKNYFEKVYPDIDFDRVYNSDMKKMIKWFTTLKNNDIEIKLSEPPEEEPVAVVEEEPEEIVKPKKKETVKKQEEKAAAKPAPAAKKKTTAAKAKKEEPAKKEEKKTSAKSESATKKKAATKSKDETPKKDTKKKSPTKKK